MISPNYNIFIGQKYSVVLKAQLLKYFSEVIEMPGNPLTDSRLSGHIDMMLLKTGDVEVLIPRNLAGTDIDKILLNRELKISYTYKKQVREYPEDVIINVCPVGDYLFYNPKTADVKVTEIFSDRKAITVNQGYTGCAVCRIGNDSIITADTGIHAAAEKAGLNSLLIKSGGIDLEGYDCGFIGGASIPVNEKLILFTGIIEKHPSYSDIRAFLSNISVEFNCLTDLNIFDIGGAVII